MVYNVEIMMRRFVVVRQTRMVSHGEDTHIVTESSGASGDRTKTNRDHAS